MNWILIRKIDSLIGIPLIFLIFVVQKIRGIFFPSKGSNDYKKILLIKFWGIGNILMLLPAAQALKIKYPNAKIDFLTISSNYEIVRLSGLFDNIYVINTKNGIQFLKTTWKALWLLKKSAYDLLIDFEQFARFSALLSALIASAKKIGFHTWKQHRHFVYSNPVPYDNTIHMTQSFFSLAVKAGVDWPKIILPFTIPIEKKNEIKVLGLLNISNVRPEDAVIIFHVGTSNNFKERRWPSQHFVKLADKLIENYKVKIVLTGLPKEKEIIQSVFDNCKYKDAIIDLSGQLNILDFVSLIDSSHLVISPDTSTVHLASTLSTPVVGIYGPNTPLLYGPWGPRCISFYENLSCSPCITNFNSKLHKCRHPQGRGYCMKKISPETVFKKIQKHYLDNNLFFPAGAKK